MKICSTCGTQNNDGDRFCINCGSELTAAAPQPVQAQPVVPQPTMAPAPQPAQAPVYNSVYQQPVQQPKVKKSFPLFSLPVDKLIKIFALGMFALDVLTCLILFFVFIGSRYTVGIGFLVLLGGPIVTAVLNAIIYGFGDIVGNCAAMKKKMFEEKKDEE